MDRSIALRNEDVEAAIAAGIVTPEQAASLIAFLAGRVGASALEAPGADEEKFRILGGFNDILVAIGLLLLIAALFSFVSIMGGAFGFSIGAIVIAWLLAEFFTARLKLALPSIILALMFVISFTWVISGLLVSGSAQTVAVVAGLTCAVAATIHYARFRVPIDVALAAGACVVAAVAASTLAAPDLAKSLVYAITLLCGVAVFALAMRFDLADPLRRTRKADIAFWLHLLAAPLIVHSIIAGLFGSQHTRFSTFFGLLVGNGDSLMHTSGDALSIAMLVLVFAFLLVALVIDRRAMLVSGLTYAGYAFWTLLKNVSGAANLTTPVTLLALALLVLGVSAGWQWLRAFIVSRLPLGRLVAKLPPLRQPAVALK